MARIIRYLFLFLTVSLFAQNPYWVSPTGAATWANAQSATALSGTACASLATMNANVDAGDTVNFRDGTYSSDGINPVNSGSSGNIITLQAHADETPVISFYQSTVSGIELNGIDYVKVDGIDVQDCYRLIYLHSGADYNEFTNMTVSGGGAGNQIPNNGIVVYSVNYGTANTNNWFHHCTMYEAGYVDPVTCDDDGGLILVGQAGHDYESGYNTFEDCILYWGSHHVASFNSAHNVFRNNVVHNEGHFAATATCEASRGCSDDGYFGNRNFTVRDYNEEQGTSRNLVENNRFGHMGIASDGNAEGNCTIASNDNIVRFNYSFNAMEAGYYFRSSSYVCKRNYFYNNTSYHQGNMPSCARTPGTRDDGLYVQNSVDCADNVIKNCIFYDNVGQDILDAGGRNTYSTNWVTTDGDPLFVNTDISDPTSTTLPNLSLTTNSPCLNGGTYLTQANGSGSSSTSLTVDDAGYFQDGSGLGSGLTSVDADWIAIGTIGNTVQISSINYSTDVITLASAMTWSDNDNIWLYKDSDGTVVLNGTAPNYGAYQGTGESTIGASKVVMIFNQIQIMPIFWALFSVWAYAAIRAINKFL